MKQDRPLRGCLSVPPCLAPGQEKLPAEETKGRDK